jgi:DNA-binding IclR family transcriptional regulator
MSMSTGTGWFCRSAAKDLNRTTRQVTPSAIMPLVDRSWSGLSLLAAPGPPRPPSDGWLTDMGDDDDEVVITSDGRRIRPVKSVARAIDLLEVLGDNGEPMSLTELATAVHCSKTAAYNLITTLELRGLLRKSPDLRYTLGWKLLEWGEVVHSASTFGEAALAELVALSETTGETAMMAVLDGETVMCVELVESSRSVPLSVTRGSREIASEGAAGQVLLAFSTSARRRRLLERFDPDGARQLSGQLDVVRREGVASVTERGEVAVAAPVFDYSGDVVAAVAVLGPESRLPSGRMPDVAKAVAESGRAITATLGGARARPPLASSA